MTKPFEGVPMQLGSQKYVVPALSLGQVRKLSGEIEALRSASGEAVATAALPIITAAIQRNHPDVSAESLEGLIGLNQVQQLLKIAFGTSDSPYALSE